MKWINQGVKRKIEEDGIDLAIMTVDILKAAAAAATSVPALGAAAGIISCILQQISQAQQNTELALRVATRCVRALATISKHLDTLEITPAVLENIKHFVADLHEVQDFIERETNSSMLYRVLFTKKRADRLQDLQLRFQDTMALFQITALITIHDIVQRHSSRFLDIEDVASGLGRLEKAPKDESDDNRIIEESDVALKEELFVRTGLRLHLAQVGGKCAVVKVFEGKDASKNYAAAVKFEEHLMHPHLLHLKKISRVNIPTPFMVYDLDAQGSAEQFIAAAIPSGVVSTFVAGAQLISGAASALSHLCLRGIPFHSVRIENFSIFMSGANKVVLSFDGIWNSTSFASRQDRTGVDVLGELCHQTFNAANEILYRDTLARTIDTSEPFATALFDAEHGGQSDTMPDKSDTTATTDTNLSRPRREIIWQGVTGNSITLDDISRQFKSILSSLSFTSFSLERVARSPRSYWTVHRCPGYRREEVTLRPVLLDCMVITHATPSLHEKCFICEKDVKRGLFRCKCRQPDDGISPTVKCTKCSVWGHSHCNDQLGYICWKCSDNHGDGGGIDGDEGAKYDGLNPRRHYRQDLNNYAIQAGLTLTYSESGPDKHNTWTSIAYVDDNEIGRGNGPSKGRSKEAAAYKGLNFLGLNTD